MAGSVRVPVSAGAAIFTGVGVDAGVRAVGGGGSTSVRCLSAAGTGLIAGG